MEEYLDILNEKREKTGRTASKKQAHTEGLWHYCAHIWIYNSNKEILLQKRSPNKETFPNYWDISAAGHICAGEEPINGALRELQEELGIVAESEELQLIKQMKIEFEYKPKNIINREHCSVYLLKWDGDSSNLKLQEEEVSEVKFVKIDDFSKFCLPERGLVVPHENYYSMIEKEIASRN